MWAGEKGLCSGLYLDFTFRHGTLFLASKFAIHLFSILIVASVILWISLFRIDGELRFGSSCCPIPTAEKFRIRSGFRAAAERAR